MRKILVSMFLCATALCAVEWKVPLKPNVEGYVQRFVPLNGRNFTEGKLDVSCDMLRAQINKNTSVTFFLRAAKWTGMGYQHEGVVFDPHDMHYSLVGGFRGDVGDYSTTLRLMHDCFHVVDRPEEGTVIWNIYELSFAPADHFWETRRTKIREKTAHLKYPKIAPHFYWCAKFGIYPLLTDAGLSQYNHRLSTHTAGEFALEFVQFRNGALNFEWKPVLWTKYGGGTCSRQYIELNAAHYAQFGTLSAYLGYFVHEDQPIRATDGRTTWGFRWQF